MNELPNVDMLADHLDQTLPLEYLPNLEATASGRENSPSR